ncbi:MAG: hypothetical protein HZA61_10820 [Candidatus Eisenbacteria bacterium]|uniref:Nucleotidyltransferase n=1 Tax=Eiseniibacteriota bacterium TaxID=2212470 RepID=A0A933SEP2_UNCEI|nr:hypothetical protein [Candidatus Eisenbacteria bacterium]
MNAHEVEYIVVGAVGLVFNGLVRGTDDADLFIRPTRENMFRLHAALRDVWDDERIPQVDFFGERDELYAVTYVSPDGGLSVDFLPRLGEAFAYDDLVAHWVDFEDMRVHVATPRTLQRMKARTPRMQDHADAEKLRQHFGLEEV